MLTIDPKEIPVPKWEGVNIPVDFKTANKVGTLRTKVRNGSVKMMNDVMTKQIEMMKEKFAESQSDNNQTTEQSQ